MARVGRVVFEELVFEEDEDEDALELEDVVVLELEDVVALRFALR